MANHNTDRRSFLRTVGAIGAVGTGSLAGCIELGDSDDVEAGEEFPEIQFVFATSGTNPQRNELAGLIADNMEEVGFEVDRQPREFLPQVDQTVNEHDFDVSLLGWGGTPERIDPHIFLMDMHHSDFDEPGGRNTPGYNNPDYDELAEAQAVEADPDERRDIVFEAQEVLAEDQPRCYIANEGGYHPYNAERLDSVNGTLGEGLNGFWNFMDLEPADGVEEVYFGYPADIGSLNPMRDLATPDRQFIRLLYDQLFRYDEVGDPEPWLATDEPEVTDDGTTYTIEIRDDHTFHDGEPVTAEDVKFSYELFEEHSPTYSTYLTNLEEVTASGNEVTMHLSEPEATFATHALAQIYIFPEHIWAEIDDPADEDDETYTGSGPFQFDDWELETEMQLSSFDDHFHPPNVDRLIRIPGDEGALMDEIEAGDIDMVGSVPSPAQQDTFEDLDSVGLDPWDAVGHAKLAYNMRRDHMDDVHIRRAISYCVPKETFVEDIMGAGTVTHTPIAPAVESWHNPDVREYTEDLDAAREELEEGGYVISDDQVHYPAEE